MNIKELQKIVQQSLHEGLDDYITDSDNITLYHYSNSNEPTLSLDPKSFGKNSFTRRDVAVSGTPRIFFYLDPKQKEQFFLSANLYTTSVPRASIMTYEDVPMEVKEAIKSKNYGRLDLDALLKYISLRASGFYYKTGDTEIVIWFRPIVATMEKTNTAILTEEVSNKFQQLMFTFQGQTEVETIGILTAENPGGIAAPDQKNLENNRKLVSALKRDGLDFVPIAGKYGSEENSFVLFDVQKNILIEIGQRYGQKAVIYGEKGASDDSMIFQYIEGDVVKETASEVRHGPEAEARDDNYSMYDGQKFYIPFFE